MIVMFHFSETLEQWNNVAYPLTSIGPSILLSGIFYFDYHYGIYESTTKSKTTKRQIFSPSDSVRYVLVCYKEGDRYKILKASEIIAETDGEVEMRNGETAVLVFSGEHIISKFKFLLMSLTFLL